MLVGYARVSTRDQNQDLQNDALTSAGCEKIFTETASGSKVDRPQLIAALGYMRSGDTLIVWKLDRLARSTKQLLETVEMLNKRGIGFRCLTQDLDTTTAGGKLIFTIFAAIAEFERELIRERTHAGLVAARARGKAGGRPPVMTAEKIKQARTLANDPDYTVAEICKTIGISRDTYYRHLKNENR